MISIVGVGKMGSAIAAGLVESGKASDLTLVVRPGSSTDALAARFPDVAIVDAPIPCDGAVLAVKPNDIAAIAAESSRAGAQRLLSVAAGVSLAALQKAAGDGATVLRAMPNIGAEVQQSATVVCSLTNNESDLAWADSVLKPLGIVVHITEAQMDAATGLAGSGTAYILLVLESMIDAGVNAGLSAAVSKQLALATLQGAGALAVASDKTPGQLRATITTPAGTTVAGLRVLEQRAVRAAFIDAVAAAAERSREIGRSSH